MITLLIFSGFRCCQDKSCWLESRPKLPECIVQSHVSLSLVKRILNAPVSWVLFAGTTSRFLNLSIWFLTLQILSLRRVLLVSLCALLRKPVYSLYHDTTAALTSNITLRSVKDFSSVESALQVAFGVTNSISRRMQILSSLPGAICLLPPHSLSRYHPKVATETGETCARKEALPTCGGKHFFWRIFGRHFWEYWHRVPTRFL